LGTFIKFRGNNSLADSEEAAAAFLLKVVAGSVVVRQCARIAYLKKRLGLSSPDIIEEIPFYLA
jgi:NAD(P)H-hydrate repair Nnr-like enzyme with NAD(P)H-hydrate dehydratase domain